MRRKTQPKGTVYLQHLEKRMFRAQHYIGFAEEGNLEARLSQHGTTAGSKMLFAARARGIDFKVVRTWTGVTRQVERSLKNKKDARSLCPLCREERKEAKKFYDAMRKLQVRRIDRGKSKIRKINWQ